MTTTLILLKLLCYLLSLALLFGSCLLVSSYRLIYSIFSLVLVFFCGIWFFIIYEAEYALFIFLVVYLGAVVVFFIFVIMLLNPTVNQLHNEITSTEIIALSSFIIVTLTIFLFIIRDSFDFGKKITLKISVLDQQYIQPMLFTNIEKIGFVLYTDFGVLLILIGFLLFVTILGCVLILKPANRK